ncbi:MAG TPA: ATP-binding protein [Candidatus Acidoferrales bacterium]|nr:ATP-binding protein [Candidatus Acidoferrales bacterium]
MRSARTRADDDSESVDDALRAVFEVSESALVTYDHSGRIRAANARLRQLLELGDAEWASLSDFPSFSKVFASRLATGQPSLRPPWLLCERGNGAVREQWRLAGGTRVIERLARPLGGDSEASLGWVERYRDLTAERELPARLLQTYKLAALGQMTAGITHELNNPLTTITGYGQLLLEQPLGPKALADVRRICQEGERAGRIVRSLLMMAREAKVERSPVNLNELVERILRLCGYDLKHTGISVVTDLDPELPGTLANPVQLQQVVLNLVLNSQQAIAEGGRPGRLSLRTRHTPASVLLEVEDDGPGIPVELHSRIFEPFFTTKPVGVGTGLGLSIASGILQQHGGEIRVSSEPGAGATFVVELPLVREQPSEPARREVDGSRQAIPGSRILVIEEEGGVGQLIADALGGEGHRVQLVTEPADALAHLESGSFDLLISDLKFSAPGFMALHRALATSEAVRSGRLLLLGSDPIGSGAFDFRPEGHYQSLAKPFLLAELKAAVACLLAANEQPAGQR